MVTSGSTPPLPPKHDPVRVAYDLRDQLASAKRQTALFLGAGASISANVPSLDQLTKIVDAGLADPFQKLYQGISKIVGANANLEQVLNKVRTIRDLLEESSSGDYQGLSHQLAKKLDSAICRIIYEKIATPDLDKLEAHRSLAAWLRHIRRDSPVEVFTTNYDLLLEISFEMVGAPFFDGFVGAVSPFFVPESVDAELGRADDVYPPRSWIRLWKLHGSVNWQLISGPPPAPDRICRVTGICSPADDTQLLIYPSRDKYLQSRRLPFVVYIDRLRRLLQYGECLLLVIGYSFRDEHINDVLSQGLRSNPRLAITAALHDKPSEYVLSLAQMHKNFSLFSPDEASIGGIRGGWLTPGKKRPGEEWPFWDEASNRFVLGNFSRFAEFMNVMTGYQDTKMTPASPWTATGVPIP